MRFEFCYDLFITNRHFSATSSQPPPSSFFILFISPLESLKPSSDPSHTSAVLDAVYLSAHTLSILNENTEQQLNNIINRRCKLNHYLSSSVQHVLHVQTPSIHNKAIGLVKKQVFGKHNKQNCHKPDENIFLSNKEVCYLLSSYL